MCVCVCTVFSQNLTAVVLQQLLIEGDGAPANPPPPQLITSRIPVLDSGAHRLWTRCGSSNQAVSWCQRSVCRVLARPGGSNRRLSPPGCWCRIVTPLRDVERPNFGVLGGAGAELVTSLDAVA